MAKTSSSTKAIAAKKQPAGLKLNPGEKYEVMHLPGLKKQYAVTSHGRLVSFNEKMSDGAQLKLNTHKQGYRIWRFRLDGVSTHYLLHRLVAEYFVKKPSPGHDYVIHLDYDKTNNHFKNLKWVNYEEQRAHAANSEASKANAHRLSQWSRITGKGKKLSEAQVRRIKKALRNPKRKKLADLAAEFGISIMQLHRIKTGENWGWVEV